VGAGRYPRKTGEANRGQRVRKLSMRAQLKPVRVSERQSQGERKRGDRNKNRETARGHATRLKEKTCTKDARGEIKEGANWEKGRSGGSQRKDNEMGTRERTAS